MPQSSAMQLLADNKVVDAKVQDVADRYEVGDMLGEGRFSQVFSATRGKQSVALKAVDMATLEEDEEAVEALVQEVTALRRAYAASKGHVPKVHEVLQTAETVYVVMDQVRGCELFEMLEQGPLSESSARRLIAQLLSALSSLHKHHVVHRDVKPENLMVTDVDDPSKCRLVMVRTKLLRCLSLARVARMRCVRIPPSLVPCHMLLPSSHRVRDSVRRVPLRSISGTRRSAAAPTISLKASQALPNTRRRKCSRGWTATASLTIARATCGLSVLRPMCFSVASCPTTFPTSRILRSTCAPRPLSFRSPAGRSRPSRVAKEPPRCSEPRTS